MAGLVRVARGKPLDATDDPVDLRDLALDGLEAFALDHHLRVARGPPHELLEELHGVGDHLEWIVDLVREADRELAEGRQTVALADLEEVLGEPDRPDLLAVLVVGDRARDRDRNGDRVLGEEDGLAVLDRAARPALVAPHGAHHFPGMLPALVEQGHRLPEHLFRSVAEGLAGAVVVKDDQPLPVDGNDDVGEFSSSFSK